MERIGPVRAVRQLTLGAVRIFGASSLELVFRVAGELQGTIADSPPTPGSALDINFTIRDSDEPTAGYEVTVLSDDGPGGELAKPVESFRFLGNTPADSTYAIDEIHYEGPGQYLFIEVHQIDEEGQHDQAWTAPVWFEPSDDEGATTAGASVRIVHLFANPAGDERQHEALAIANEGDASVDLSGWSVQDLAGNRWSLDALSTLAAGSQDTIRRDGQSMALNNGGDTIVLLAPDGSTVQTVRYDGVAEGEWIEF